MKKYKLSYLPIALEDLGSIVDYICNVLQNPIAAENILNKIESAIIERLDMCCTSFSCLNYKEITWI